MAFLLHGHGLEHLNHVFLSFVTKGFLGAGTHDPARLVVRFVVYFGTVRNHLTQLIVPQLRVKPLLPHPHKLQLPYSPYHTQVQEHEVGVLDEVRTINKSTKHINNTNSHQPPIYPMVHVVRPFALGVHAFIFEFAKGLINTAGGEKTVGQFDGFAHAGVVYGAVAEEAFYLGRCSFLFVDG